MFQADDNLQTKERLLFRFLTLKPSVSRILKKIFPVTIYEFSDNSSVMCFRRRS